MSDDITGQALEDVCCEQCGERNAETLLLASDKYSSRANAFPVVRCRTCGLVYVNPRPNKDSISSFYLAEYYSAEVFHQNAAADALRSLQTRRLRDIGRFVRPGRILDVGCGAGQFLASARDAGWTTCGIEVSGIAAGYARDHYGLDVIERDLLSAELSDSSFDVVTMWGVLEHLHHPRAALQEVHRILKPGGLFATLLPNINSTQAKTFGAKWYLLDVPRHLYHFSEATLKQMACSVGLQPVWMRFFAREHDLPNLVRSLHDVLYPDGVQVSIGEASPPVHKPAAWAWRRVLMGVLRRAAPVLARAMAGRRSSAAIEAYFEKPRCDNDE